MDRTSTGRAAETRAVSAYDLLGALANVLDVLLGTLLLHPQPLDAILHELVVLLGSPVRAARITAKYPARKGRHGVN